MTSDASTATKGRITDEAVESLRSRIGLQVPAVALGYRRASWDVLVNFARSTGDVNPLYRSEEYASATRWGGLIGYPVFLQYMGDGGWAAPPEFDLDRLRGDPLAGVHGLHAGMEMHFFRPIRENDTFAVRGGLSGVEVKSSKLGGQAVHEHHDKVYWNQDGETVGVLRQFVVRVEHASARTRGTLSALPVPTSYTADDRARVEEAYDREYCRGAEPRYWEDVAVGDESVPLPKGPFTVTSFICQMMGIGLLRRTLFFVHSEAHQYRRRHPRAFPLDHLGIPDTVASVHWEREAAIRAGVPERYDAGAERVVGAGHAVINWMGDDAFLRRLRVQVRGFVFVGDLVLLTCSVTQKFESDEGCGVSLTIEGRNQRDEIVVQGDADVLLPSRARGPVELGMVVPDDISMFQHDRPEATVRAG